MEWRREARPVAEPVVAEVITRLIGRLFGSGGEIGVQRRDGDQQERVAVEVRRRERQLQTDGEQEHRIEWHPRQHSKMLAVLVSKADSRWQANCTIGKVRYACAVMPDHIHLVIRKHRMLAEEMIEQIQSLSRKRLVECGLRELAHPTWTRGGWIVFLDHPDEVWRTVRYLEMNPLALRLPVQEWGFVTAYDNWPLHAGHSPNSPYVRALRAAGRYDR